MNSIRYADEIAQRINSHVILFHSISEQVVATMVTTEEEASYPAEVDFNHKREKFAKLKRIKENLENTEWGIPVSYETRIRSGEAQRVIISVAKEEKADLMLMGAKFTKAVSETAEHSLTGKVVQQAFCPVLLIPHNTTFRPIRRMVLATYLRGFCLSDMTLVLKLANYFGAQLQLLHVLPKEDATARQFSMEELQRLNKRISHPRISQHVEVNPSISEGINQFCQNHRADMLVMCAHAHNAGKHAFQPLSSNLPLLLIRAKKIQF